MTVIIGRSKLITDLARSRSDADEPLVMLADAQALLAEQRAEIEELQDIVIAQSEYIRSQYAARKDPLGATQQGEQS